MRPVVAVARLVWDVVQGHVVMPLPAGGVGADGGVRSKRNVVGCLPPRGETNHLCVCGTCPPANPCSAIAIWPKTRPSAVTGTAWLRPAMMRNDGAIRSERTTARQDNRVGGGPGECGLQRRRQADRLCRTDSGCETGELRVSTKSFPPVL